MENLRRLVGILAALYGAVSLLVFFGVLFSDPKKLELGFTLLWQLALSGGSLVVGVLLARKGPRPGPKGSQPCPVCRRAGGSGVLVTNQVLETKTRGIPLVLSLISQKWVTKELRGVCDECETRRARRQALAAPLIVAPLLILLPVGWATASWFWLFAIGALILYARFFFYTWADRLLWGNDLASRLGLGRGWRFPVPLAQLVLRVTLAFMLVAGLLASLSPPS